MILRSLPSLANFITLLLQYPSATKKIPVSSDTAREVGLQKWAPSEPGTNFSPNTRSALVEPAGNFEGKKKHLE